MNESGTLTCTCILTNLLIRNKHLSCDICLLHVSFDNILHNICLYFKSYNNLFVTFWKIKLYYINMLSPLMSL